MTNRRKLLTELEQLSSAELFAVLGPWDLANKLSDLSCIDCRAGHLAECEVDKCNFSIERWLDMPCTRESILKEVAPECSD